MPLPVVKSIRKRKTDTTFSSYFGQMTEKSQKRKTQNGDTALPRRLVNKQLKKQHC